MIKEAMNIHIPFTFTAPKHFYALSLKATKLHAALKNINRCINYLSSNPIGDIRNMNSCLRRAALLAEMDILLLTQEKINSSLSDLIAEIKQHKHTIWQACNFEKKQEQSKQIKFYIN